LASAFIFPTSQQHGLNALKTDMDFGDNYSSWERF